MLFSPTRRLRARPIISFTTAPMVAGAFAALGCLASHARAQATTELVSVDIYGYAGGGTSPSMSSEGRYLAFNGGWYLVPGDLNFLSDVFVRDRLTGTTTLVSVDSSGVQGNGDSWLPAISGNGQVVAFRSFASNLVANDTNGLEDAFVHDSLTGQTERLNVSSAGTESNGSVRLGMLSFDGRYVTFDSVATNLVANDNNQQRDVFWRDRQTGQTVRVSVSSSGVEGNGSSSQPSISFDGRYVCFTSASSNLSPNDTNQAEDVFVHDTQMGQTVRVSSTGGQGTGNSNFACISGDGRWVSFTSDASDLVSGDNNATADVFVHDTQNGQTSLLSLDSGGAQGNAGSWGPRISSDGRHVSFLSEATNLVTIPLNALHNVYLRDRQAGTTTLVSVDSNGVAGGVSFWSHSISGDGRSIAFDTLSSLVPNDTNNYEDVFVHDEGAPPILGFCAGDGSGTACPCGNASAPGSGTGCLSSLGTGGLLVGAGVASLASETFHLQGSLMPNSSALYFQGNSSPSGGAGAVFGDGLRCASGPVRRLGTKLNVAGVSTYPAPGDLPVSVKGACVAGDFRTYQIWYRNAAAFCTPLTFNLTNGVNVTWVP